MKFFVWECHHPKRTSCQSSTRLGWSRGDLMNTEGTGICLREKEGASKVGRNSTGLSKREVTDVRK